MGLDEVEGGDENGAKESTLDRRCGSGDVVTGRRVRHGPSVDLRSRMYTDHELYGLWSIYVLRGDWLQLFWHSGTGHPGSGRYSPGPSNTYAISTPHRRYVFER
jgi:hypothetical protein